MVKIVFLCGFTDYFVRLGDGNMAFKVQKKESCDFLTPQEMFQDNKLKSVKGILDYQSQMIDNYMKTINGATVINKNVAFELPTGSGKTLVGILIAEYHRRKFKRKSLFLCPTNQLVAQVCDQAQKQYGMDALPFMGRQAEYDTNLKTRYLTGQAIGVTTYSSFFATNSFFINPDILIFDDVHSSESYIIDNWSLDIDRTKYLTLYLQIAQLLEDAIGESGLSRMLSDNPYSSDIMDWNNLLPRPKIAGKIKQLQELLQASASDTPLKYAWSRIADNLSECHIYVSWHSILIRPYIPPTETHDPFSNSSQRIFMSATLGNSGELERLTGCKKITRLPVVSDWDTKGLGRRLFIFPDLSLETDTHKEILIKLHKEAKRSVLIVPSDNDSREITDILQENVAGIQIYKAADLIDTKESFCKSENAMVIMANRFDGVDFPDDESKMLFIYNLPKFTHLQEKFFIGKMAASILYAERIKTRIVQAVGRCTRNASDYSVVCILGDSVLNEITSSKILSTYHPEMRAEINFGVENSTDFKSVDDIVENVRIFYDRGDEWAEAETGIVDSRNRFIAEGPNSEQQKLFGILFKAAQIEVDIQYDLWRKNYQSAYEKASQIVEILNAPSLSGYKCFWQYICGSLSLEIGDIPKAKQYFIGAANNNKGNIQWLADLVSDISHDITPPVAEDYVFDIINALEDRLLKNQNNNRFEEKSKLILDGLLSDDGNAFEIAHLELGLFLGYDAYNTDSSAAPDPYWIVNDKLCIVAEDKIYKDVKKEIPVEDVRQAASHSVWLKENVKTLNADAHIITVFISNSSSIDTAARTFAKDVYYINRKELHEWALVAINSLRTARSAFQEAGDSEWRAKTKELFIENNVTPRAFIQFITRMKLADLPK